MRKAWSVWLMPRGAQALTQLLSIVSETAMQRQGQVRKAFDDLSMGRMSHSTFWAQWEHLVVDMEVAGIDPWSDNTLFGWCLSELSPGLKHASFVACLGSGP